MKIAPLSAIITLQLGRCVASYKIDEVQAVTKQNVSNLIRLPA